LVEYGFFFFIALFLFFLKHVRNFRRFQLFQKVFFSSHFFDVCSYGLFFAQVFVIKIVELFVPEEEILLGLEV